MADGVGGTLRGYACEYKGPVCPLGYVWLHDICVGAIMNKVADGTRAHSNCRVGGSSKYHLLYTLNSNEVGNNWQLTSFIIF